MSEVTGGESGDTAMAITLLEIFLSISAVLAEFTVELEMVLLSS